MRRGPESQGAYKVPYIYAAMGSDYCILTTEGADAGIECVIHEVENLDEAVSYILNVGDDKMCVAGVRTFLQILSDVLTFTDSQLRSGAHPSVSLPSAALGAPHFSWPIWPMHGLVWRPGHPAPPAAGVAPLVLCLCGCSPPRLRARVQASPAAPARWARAAVSGLLATTGSTRRHGPR